MKNTTINLQCAADVYRQCCFFVVVFYYFGALIYVILLHRDWVHYPQNILNITMQRSNNFFGRCATGAQGLQGIFP